MSTHNICFYKENQKKKQKNTKTSYKRHLISSSLIFLFKETFSIGMYTFYHKVSEYFWKP